MATLPSSRGADPTAPAGGSVLPPIGPQVPRIQEMPGEDQSPAQPVSDTGEEETANLMYFTAFDFGWQTCLHYGCATSSDPATFESIESELEKQWSQQHAATAKQLPWQAARDTARDAWDRVFDALAEDSRPKG